MSDQIVKGLAELQAFLDQLTPKLEKSIVRGAMRAGAKIVLTDAKSNISSVSGELAASGRITTSARRGVVTARVLFGSNKGGIANQPIWVEYGTRPHLITAGSGSINAGLRGQLGFATRVAMQGIKRASLVIRGRFVGPLVHHPGAKPHAFLRPALDSSKTTAVVAAADYIKARLTKQGLDASSVSVEAQ